MVIQSSEVSTIQGIRTGKINSWDFANVCCIVDVRGLSSKWSYTVRAVGRGCLRGFEWTPLSVNFKRFYTTPRLHFKYPTICKWFTSLIAIENQRCPHKFAWLLLATVLFMEDRRVNAEHERIKHWGERTHAQIHKLVLDSSPVSLQFSHRQEWVATEQPGVVPFFWRRVETSVTKWPL